MTVFQNCLHQQLQAHSSMEPRDVVKLCYQAACGAEHLLSDFEEARRYFYEEFTAVSPKEGPLVEQISEGVCRINLDVWKQAKLPGEWLLRMFMGTVFQTDGKQRLTEYLAAAEPVLESFGFPMDDWRCYLTEYVDGGMPPVRHSCAYRAAEQPAYRIVDTAYLPLLPILERAAKAIGENRPFIIAVDGRAGAGKSTLAEKLCQILDGGVVYMDDFFLPPSMRDEERLAEAGGNVHYERFARQVLPYLKEQGDFSYEIFDCSRMAVNGLRTVANGSYCIVEGSYSHHPYFGDYMDLRVFVDVDPAEQLRRITLRNGEEMAEIFRTRWIPMENRYFEAFDISQQADILIK